MTEEERQTKLAHFVRCKEEAKKAYDGMYGVHFFRGANDCYRDTSDYFCAAIRQAEDLGLPNQTVALPERLEHVKAVFRRQFAR